MSDADRERVVQKLNAAVGEGRITLAEFEERVAGVLAARTFGEVEPFLADLPHAVPPLRDVIELKSMASTLNRSGAWTVPRRLVVRNSAGSVKLDFTDALITYPVVEIHLDVLAGTTVLVLPPGATVDASEVHTMAGSLKIRQQIGEHGGNVHFVVSGRQRMGDLVVRHQYRFWGWRW
jgi:Domain of unknown function (DUF1707)